MSTNINWLPNTTITAYLQPRINANDAFLFTVENRIGLRLENENNRQNPFFILEGATIGSYSSVQRPADNIPYTIQFKVDEEYAYLSVYQNGNLVGSSVQPKSPYGSFVAGFNTPVTLFGWKQPNDACMYLGNIYEVKLFDKDMNLYAEFVPCYNKGDLVLGCYETFSGQFFPFTRNIYSIETGPDIAPPERPWE